MPRPSKGRVRVYVGVLSGLSASQRPTPVRLGPPANNPGGVAAGRFLGRVRFCCGSDMMSTARYRRRAPPETRPPPHPTLSG